MSLIRFIKNYHIDQHHVLFMPKHITKAKISRDSCSSYEYRLVSPKLREKKMYELNLRLLSRHDWRRPLWSGSFPIGPEDLCVCFSSGSSSILKHMVAVWPSSWKGQATTRWHWLSCAWPISPPKSRLASPCLAHMIGTFTRAWLGNGTKVWWKAKIAVVTQHITLPPFSLPISCLGWDAKFCFSCSSTHTQASISNFKSYPAKHVSISLTSLTSHQNPRSSK